MTVTATLGGADPVYAVHAEPRIPRPIIRITIPRLFRKGTRENPNFIQRVRNRFTLTARTIAGVFLRIGERLWENRLVRYASYFVFAVATYLALLTVTTTVAFLLAVPFALMGWYMMAELVFWVVWFAAMWSIIWWGAGEWVKWLESHPAPALVPV